MNSQVVEPSRFKAFLQRVGEMTARDLLHWSRYRNTIHADFRYWRLTLIEAIDNDFPELELSFRSTQYSAVAVQSVLFGGATSGLARLWDLAQEQIDRLQVEPKKPFEDKQLQEVVSTTNLFFVDHFLWDARHDGS